MRLTVLMALMTVAVACSDSEPTSDAGAPPTPKTDASVAQDTGMTSDASVSPDAGRAPDTGPIPCEPACGDDETCEQQRCVRACPCRDGERCDPSSGLCRPLHCANDSVCPPHLNCLRGRCIRLARACTNDSDCNDGAHCSEVRQCITDACISHSDCEPSARCATGRCLPRLNADPRIFFERVRDPHLDAHFSSLPGQKDDRHEEPAGEMGYGGTLLDFDGDLDLDVYVGSQSQEPYNGVPACLYRNDSLPGALRFTRIEEHCGWREPRIHGVFGLDLENDGFHEALLAGSRTLILKRFHPEEREINLLERLIPNDRRHSCLPASAVAIDINLDGRLDLYVGCQLNSVEIEENDLANIVFFQDENGELIPARNALDYPLLMRAEGSTLALGAADLDDDGLLELMLSQDSIPLPDEWVTHPGGIYKRCSPLEPCLYSSHPLGPGDAGYRHLMGSGVLQVENLGEAVYFTDVDINQLVTMTDEPARNRAPDHGIDMTFVDAMVEFYSWGVIVDDFDRDGFDDLFLGRGSVIPHPAYDFTVHWDALLLQRPGQPFDIHSEDVGITPFSTDDTGHESYVYSSRAALKSDLDYDGHLDILGMGMEGAPRLHREVPLAPVVPPRCTLVPMPRYAPGFGTGHQLLPPNGPARKWDSQGQLRSGTSPFIVSPWQQASIRFPSGAKVPFDCQGQAGPFVVVEPAWLTLLQTDQDGLLIQTGAARPEGLLTVLSDPEPMLLEVDDLGDGRARVALPEGTRRVMLRFGSRWLPRWFDL